MKVKMRELYDAYAREVAYFGLMLFFWPLGATGFFICYAWVYWMSKKENAHPLWTYLSFILLSIALHYESKPYRALFWLRDVALLSLIHYKLRRQPGTVMNTSPPGRLLLCVLNMLLIILSTYTTLAYLQGDAIPTDIALSFVMSTILITVDMMHILLEYFFEAQHGDRRSIILYYVTTCVKSALIYKHTGVMPWLYALTLCQLDMMTYADITSVHSISFKVLSTTYLMTSLCT